MEARSKVVSSVLSLVATYGFATQVFATASDPEPPRSSSLILEANAKGVQIYTCQQQKDKTFSWTLKAPQAQLYREQQIKIGNHFAGPTWQLDDGSSVVGEVVSKVDSTDLSAIPHLLLKAKSHQNNGLLSSATYITRSETKGGQPPKDGCDLQHLAKEIRVPYTAKYKFFKDAGSK